MVFSPSECALYHLASSLHVQIPHLVVSACVAADISYQLPMSSHSCVSCLSVPSASSFPTSRSPLLLLVVPVPCTLLVYISSRTLKVPLEIAQERCVLPMILSDFFFFGLTGGVEVVLSLNARFVVFVPSKVSMCVVEELGVAWCTSVITGVSDDTFEDIGSDGESIAIPESELSRSAPVSWLTEYEDL